MYLTKIVLENSSQVSRDNPVFSNGARLLNFRLKTLVIKLSLKLPGLSISLAMWMNAFLLSYVTCFFYFVILAPLRHTCRAIS